MLIQPIAQSAKNNYEGRRYYAQLFRRQRLLASIQQTFCRIFRLNNGLRQFNVDRAVQSAWHHQELGLKTVNLSTIIGTENKAYAFDKQFYPLKDNIRDRWVNIAVRFRSGAGWYPVILLKLGNSYYVRDGHHRISVAKAFGCSFIDAEVITYW